MHQNWYHIKHMPQLQADGTRFNLFYSADGCNGASQIHFCVAKVGNNLKICKLKPQNSLNIDEIIVFKSKIPIKAIKKSAFILITRILLLNLQTENMEILNP